MMIIVCHSIGLQGMVVGVEILILMLTVMTDDHDNCVKKNNLREELLCSLRNALKRLPVTSQDYSEPECWTAADLGGSDGDVGGSDGDFGNGDGDFGVLGACDQVMLVTAVMVILVILDQVILVMAID